MANYLTAAEYRAAPTAVDSNNLVQDGNQTAQDAELTSIIQQASSWVDDYADQPLIASSYVDMLRVRVQNDGWLSLHPRRAPLNQLTALSIGTHAANLVAVSDLTGVFIDAEQWIVPLASGVGFTPYQFGAGLPSSRLLAKATMISGWPNTTLSSSPTVGATSFTVADPSGFTPATGSVVADDSITIIDGSSTETVTVTNVVGSTLTVAPLAYAHSTGAVISGLPGSLKRAAVFVVNGLIKARASEALVVGQMQPSQFSGDRGGLDMYLARQILDQGYVRVR